MALAPGSTISQYTIISCLGAGGMGEVYLAQDVRLGRKVALKLLYPDIQQREDWVGRLVQEARAASSLNHPNIITIYEVGQSAGSHFISTEYIDGGTLRQCLQHRALTLQEALDIAVQVAAALTTAHEAGVVHRDIKPENVMLRSDGYVKVVDFGLAKLHEDRLLGISGGGAESETRARHATHPGVVIGTVSYMSPEQARGAPVDARSDIFSLGILLYEMLTGRQPFDGETVSEVIISIVQQKPKPMARFALDVPLELERIVGKALSKSREERYQSVRDMLIDLKRLRRGLEFGSDTSGQADDELSRQLLTTGGSGSRIAPEPRQHTPPPALGSVASGWRTGPQGTPVAGTSSAEYLVKGIARHKRTALIVILVLAVSMIAVYFYQATRPVDSIAVLPFDGGNATLGAEQLGDELTERLTHSLSRLSRNLRVLPFSEMKRYTSRVSAKEVGRELNARAVLTGRVALKGDTVTISGELVDLRDHRVLWGDRIVTRFSDLPLAIQAVVASVSSSIGLRISAEDQRMMAAESLCVKGRNAWNKRTADAIREAMGFFNQALNLNPNNARAYAGLADGHNMLATYGATRPKEAFQAATDAATRALALDAGLAEAHAALAYAKFRGEWNWRDAEAEFREAIRLNPDYASAHQWFSNYLAAMGRFSEAIDETRRAQELDRTSLIIKTHFGLIYFLAGRFNDAVDACLETIELDPNFFVARRYLGLSYAQRGMHREALEQYDRALETSQKSTLMRVERAAALGLAGEGDRARGELLEVEEVAKQRYVSAYHIATIHVALRDRDRALEWLERGFTERADYMVFLKVDPRFASLRGDPRFTDLLRRMGL